MCRPSRRGYADSGRKSISSLANVRTLSALPLPAELRERIPEASQQIRIADVRFGSKADVHPPSGDVRFAPKSGHCGAGLACPLCAKTSSFYDNVSRPAGSVGSTVLTLEQRGTRIDL